MEAVPLDLASWAVGPGLPAVAEATAMLDGGADELAVGAALRRQHAADRAAFAVAAAHARRRARSLDVAGADRLVLTREALEQASHPAVAAWRAARAAAAGLPLHDWCAGTGADAVALARHAPVLAVERDPGRAVLARHRSEVLGLPVDVVTGDVLARAVDPAGGLVHADPDRRDGAGRRARTLATHGPSVVALRAAAAGAAGRLVAVLPGLRWDDPDLPEDVEVVFVEVDGQLVEACLADGAAATTARARAVLLPAGDELARPHGEVPTAPVAPVGAWLVRPAVAAVRARLHDELALALDGWRLDRRRALLSCDADPPPSPWYRAERVVAVTGARPRQVRPVLRAHPDRAVEVVLHGVQASPVAFLRAAGADRTGPDDLRVHLVRTSHGATAVVTSS